MKYIDMLKEECKHFVYAEIKRDLEKNEGRSMDGVTIRVRASDLIAFNKFLDYLDERGFLDPEKLKERYNDHT